MTPLELEDHIESLRADLKRAVDSLAATQRHCTHEWLAPVSDPEIRHEPSSFRLVTQGSDAWSEPENYREVSVPRWSRTCKKCRKKEYTKEQAPVKYEPKF